jgi:predicted RNA-binding protein with PUA-like domain
MNYWLIKSEPFVYSYDQLVNDGKTDWTGVRNYQARNNLKAMEKGDICFYYHSNEGMEIVGSAKVNKTFFQDPTTEDKNWVAVEVVPHKKFKKPVKLQDVKEDKRLANMVLVKNSRLSVQPVTAAEAKIIEELSK